MPVVEVALVDDIRGFFGDVGDDVVGGEVVGGGFQVGEREFRECRENVGGTSAVSAVAVVLPVERSFQKGRLATAHLLYRLTN